VRRLLKSQKNDVCVAIEEAGFDPHEFAWDDFEVGLDSSGYFPESRPA
jgi:hypothetical protein